MKNASLTTADTDCLLRPSLQRSGEWPIHRHPLAHTHPHSPRTGPRSATTKSSRPTGAHRQVHSHHVQRGRGPDGAGPAAMGSRMVEWEAPRPQGLTSFSKVPPAPSPKEPRLTPQRSDNWAPACPLAWSSGPVTVSQLHRAGGTGLPAAWHSTCFPEDSQPGDRAEF